MTDKKLLVKVTEFLTNNPDAGRDTVVEKFKITSNCARNLIRDIKKTLPKKSWTAPDDLDTARQQLTNRRTTELRRDYQTLLTRVAAEREMIDQFRETAQEALAEKLIINVRPPEPRKKSSFSKEHAVLVISDSHIGKFVSPDRTLGFGDYSPAIFLDRLAFMRDAVTSLIEHHVANPIEELHILFLGDLVEGMLNHSEEIPERMYAADQVLLASLAFYQLVASLAAVVPRVTCRGVVGNHGRWPSQKKMPTGGRYSNFDFVVMGQVQALIDLAGPENATFILEENPFQVFDILNWRFKVGHGDHLRGGDKAMGIPAHAIGREQNATTQRYAAKGVKPPDYYIVGDKHRAFAGPTATGRYLINGAFFADDEFAMAMNFSPCQPFQLFFGVHPQHGRSWSYDLSLTNAKPDSGSTFSLPKRLLQKL